LFAAVLGAVIVAMGSGRPARAQSVDPNANETKQQRDARMQWWREARFGMFIHWGLYSVPAGHYHGAPVPSAGEWIMHTAHIPVAEYAAFAQKFDPEQFNADTIVGIAKQAGMKYIVMTAKHHEGFAMFHSTTDPYNIYDATKFKRDPIQEMTDAAKKQGVKFGVYYSQNLDWHHPGGGTAGPAWDDAQKGDFDTYVKTISAPQVKELLTRYHPAVLWWDIRGPFTPDEVKLLTASFADDPGLIANNRLGGGVPGDTETPEQYIPATGYPGKDWETCMTINNTWGYKSDDTNFKSVNTLLHNLIDIASKGGNYLLNVGPDQNGVIPQPEVDRLLAMGKWLKANGDGIYGTTASPYKHLPFDGRATVKGRTLYLHVFTWPQAGLVLAGLNNKVYGAKVLATGEKLVATKRNDGELSISAPSTTDPNATTVAVALDGPPSVTEPEYLIPPAANGKYTLGAGDAVSDGNGPRLQGDGAKANLGSWMNQSGTVHWRITTALAGEYSASLSCSCAPNSAGSTVVIQVDGTDTTVTGIVAATRSWTDFANLNLGGTLNLSAGAHTVTIVPKSKPGLAVMNLRSLTLTPKATAQ
jgi:alpha-L-fucosidase